jgi:hypothetical protein
MSGMFDRRDIATEGVLLALHLAGGNFRLTIATPDQLTAAAAFLPRVLARFPDTRMLAVRRVEGVARLEVACLPS